MNIKKYFQRKYAQKEIYKFHKVSRIGFMI